MIKAIRIKKTGEVFAFVSCADGELDILIDVIEQRGIRPSLCEYMEISDIGYFSAPNFVFDGAEWRPDEWYEHSLLPDLKREENVHLWNPLEDISSEEAFDALHGSLF
jgi:hypothetical protein